MSGHRPRLGATDDSDPVVIVGAGGHGREVLGIFLDRGEADLVEGFVDDDPRLVGAVVDGKTVLGSMSWLLGRHHLYRAVIAVGANWRRRELARTFADAGGRFATALSPHAVVSPFATVEAGAMVCARSVINSGARVGAHAICNLASTVSHDCTVGAFVHLACGVHLAGGVTVGEGTEVGTGVVANPGVRIGDWSIVGSGAAVVKDLPSFTTAMGVPARPMAGERAAEARGSGVLRAVGLQTA